MNKSISWVSWDNVCKPLEEGGLGVKETEEVVFKGGIPEADEILQSAQLQSWLWLKHKVAGFSYAFSDWILNPYQCLRAVV